MIIGIPKEIMHEEARVADRSKGMIRSYSASGSLARGT